MTTVLYMAGLGDDDADPDVVPVGDRFGRWVHNHFTWLYFTRTFGALGMMYEIVRDQKEKPILLVILGGMMLGAETIRSFFEGHR